MTEVVKGAPASVADVVVLIASNIAAYQCRKGPWRKEEDLELGREWGLKVEAIAEKWEEAKRELGAERPRRPKPKGEALFIYPEAPARVEHVDDAQPEAKAPLVVEKLVRREKQQWFTEPVAEPVAKAVGLAGLVEELKGKAEAEPGKGLVKVAGALVALPPEPRAPFVPDDVKEMNEKHAVISNLGGKCVVMEWVPSRFTEGGNELSYQTFTSFKERYSNRYAEWTNSKGRAESALVAPMWLAHPQRRQYEGLDLVPNGPAVLPGKYLNLWRGWGVAPKKGSWKLLERHIEEVLANGDQKFADFIRRSTAWKFQNPGLPPEVVLALVGGKGAGKGAWGYVLMLIWGQHGLQVYSADHLYGKHNQHLQNKLFLFLDEAMWAGDREGERVLKGLTTEKWMMIEPKGVNAFQWPNRLGILMSGNDKWIVPASHDERRYAVNKISERWKQNRDYFRPLYEEIENGGAAAMLYDLLALDLDGWHPRENVPQTGALVEQKLLGLTGLQQWYVHKLSVGELPSPNKTNPRWVLSKTLWEDAKEHSLRNKYLTVDELGRFLREMGCEHKSNGKKWGWIFPPLAEAREAWEASAGSWEWLTPEIADWGEKPVPEEAP